MMAQFRQALTFGYIAQKVVMPDVHKALRQDVLRLQQVVEILHLLGVEFGRRVIEMHGHRGNVELIAVEGACAAAQNAAIVLKTEQKVLETRHMLADAVQEIVRTRFSR
jgi:hypothetical protein